MASAPPALDAASHHGETDASAPDAKTGGSDKGLLPAVLCLSLVGTAAANVLYAKRIRRMMPAAKTPRWQPRDDVRAAERAAERLRYEASGAEREAKQRAAWKAAEEVSYIDAG